MVLLFGLLLTLLMLQLLTLRLLVRWLAMILIVNVPVPINMSCDSCYCDYQRDGHDDADD